jgi:hypothetical protein
MTRARPAEIGMGDHDNVPRLPHQMEIAPTRFAGTACRNVTCAARKAIAKPARDHANTNRATRAAG